MVCFGTMDSKMWSEGQAPDAHKIDEIVLTGRGVAPGFDLNLPLFKLIFERFIPWD